MDRKETYIQRSSDGESFESYTSSEIDSSGDEKHYSTSHSDNGVIVVDSDSDSALLDEVSQDATDNTFIDSMQYSPESPTSDLLDGFPSGFTQEHFDLLMSGNDFSATRQDLLDPSLFGDNEPFSLDNSFFSAFDTTNIFDMSCKNYMDVRIPSPVLQLEDECNNNPVALDTYDCEGSPPALLMKVEKTDEDSEMVDIESNQQVDNVAVKEESPQAPVLTGPLLFAQCGPANNSVLSTQLARLVPSADGTGYVLELGMPTSKSWQPVQQRALQLKLPLGTVTGFSASNGVGEANPVLSSPGYTIVHSSSLSSFTGTPILTAHSALPLTGHSALPLGLVTSGQTFVNLNAQNLGARRNQLTSQQGLLTSAGNKKPYRRRSSKELKELSELEQITSVTGELHRFVICSDGEMKCALCGFHTASYSCFKSHIICSHPCWRITKKLSRNRLLVEKAVKVSVPTSCFSVPTPIPAVPIQQRVQSRKPRKRQNTGAALADLTLVEPPPSLLLTAPSVQRRGIVPSLGKHHVKFDPASLRLFRCTKCLVDFVDEIKIIQHLGDAHQVRKRPYHFVLLSTDQGRSFSSMHRCTHPGCTFSGSSRFELNVHLTSAHNGPNLLDSQAFL